MRAYKRLLPVFSLIFFVCLFTFGCAGKVFKPGKDSYVIQIKFHNSTASIEKACIKGAQGCFKTIGNLYIIHSIKSECVFFHEISHVLHGYFHDNMKATCKVRPQEN